MSTMSTRAPLAMALRSRREFPAINAGLLG
jgi:hypothetical protein